MRSTRWQGGAVLLLALTGLAGCSRNEALPPDASDPSAASTESTTSEDSTPSSGASPEEGQGLNQWETFTESLMEGVGVTDVGAAEHGFRSATMSGTLPKGGTGLVEYVTDRDRIWPGVPVEGESLPKGLKLVQSAGGPRRVQSSCGDGWIGVQAFDSPELGVVMDLDMSVTFAQALVGSAQCQ